MAPHSSFSREREGQVREHCEQLIRGTLQENATPENIETALEWCLHCIWERRHSWVDATSAALNFGALVEKLRVHSQLDAADYLEDQRSAFLACRLSRRHTHEAHAAALQAVLLLARQPARVPLRMVRSLRAIREGRLTRAAQQRRAAAEQAQDRGLLLELELRQVAEAAAQAWCDAWAEPDALPEVGPAASGAALTELSAPPSAPPSAPSTPREPEPVACARLPPALPRGALPRQWRPSAAPRVEVPEQAVVEMALQMLAGHAGELVGPAEGGAFAWRSLWVPHLSAGVLRGILGPLTELGTTLQAFRSFAAVVQAVAPWMGNGELRRQVARAAMRRRLCLREMAKLGRGGPPPRRRSEEAPGSSPVQTPDVFGLCWQSVGLVLEELVEEVVADFRGLQEGSYRGGSGPVGRHAQRGHLASGKHDGTPEGCPAELTLVRLDALVAPYHHAASALSEVIDAALAAVAQCCCERPAAQWPEAASEELVSHLARALRSAELAGRAGMGGTWLGRLWCGALSPPVQAMCQWGTTGTLHDPCGEFGAVARGPGAGGEGGLAAPALLLAQTVSSGSHVRSLHEWSQVAACASRRDASAGMASLRRCLWRSREAAGGGGSPSHAMSDTAPAEPFVPLEVRLEAHVLGPVLRLADEVSRPLLLKVLREESGGLLRHLAALRLVAFLEREDVVSPLVRRLFEHLEGRRSRIAPARPGQDALAIELNSALLEGLEQGTDREVRQLCARHLVLAVVPRDAPESRRGRSGDACSCLDDLRIAYAPPPPLERVLGESVLRSYSSVMALLLRVRYAEGALLEASQLPLFGLCDRHRRARSRRLPADFVRFARGCDALRMEAAHLVGCVGRYLQVGVLQGGTRALQGRLQWLVECGPQHASGSPRASLRHGELARGGPLDWGSPDDPGAGQQDVVERATYLHGEYVHQLMQECFLTPEFHAVLTDVQQLLGMVVEFRDLLAELAASLQPREGPPESLLEDDSSLGDLNASAAGGRVPGTDFFCHEAWQAEAAVLLARTRVADLQREFRGCVRYLLQVLMFSVGRGASQQVASLCSEINFNGFYHEGV